VHTSQAALHPEEDDQHDQEEVDTLKKMALCLDLYLDLEAYSPAWAWVEERTEKIWEAYPLAQRRLAEEVPGSMFRAESTWASLLASSVSAPSLLLARVQGCYLQFCASLLMSLCRKSLWTSASETLGLSEVEACSSCLLDHHVDGCHWLSSAVHSVWLLETSQTWFDILTTAMTYAAPLLTTPHSFATSTKSTYCCQPCGTIQIGSRENTFPLLEYLTQLNRNFN
jgi:hypothetical protein